MTYKQFKEEVENLGLEYSGPNEGEVFVTIGTVLCAAISTTEEQVGIWIYDDWFDRLSEQQRVELFQLTAALDETPLEDRGKVE